MNNLLNKLILGSSATALLAAAPLGPACAQGNADIEQVVVSASRITIAGYTQPTPVSVIGQAQLEASAYSNLQDSLKELPQVTIPPSNLSANSGGLSATTGSNFINLRQLGNIRTLTLFDGQRVVASSLNAAGVDVTTFPSALIQRVDVVTGGASASWGSDAVAGVVNFVLNKNFNGFKATIQGGTTSDNLRRSVLLNTAWGGDIAGGRGHLELAAEAKINPDTVLLPQEGWFRNAYWVSNPAFVAGSSAPQLIVANNVGLVQFTAGGIINASPAGVAGPGVVASAANALRGLQFVQGGMPQLVNYGNVTLGTLSNGGSLTTTDGQWPAQQVSAANSTYTLFGYGRYKLTDHVQASAQLNYSYFTGKSNGGVPSQAALTIKSDNAYIPASVRAIMTNGGITSFTLGTLGTNNFDATKATGQNFFAQSQGALGPLTNFVRRNLIRGVFTLEGTIGDDWSWNSYAQHSQVRLWESTPNNAILANLAAAQDAVTVTSANVAKTGLPLGSIACRQSLTGVNVVNGAITAQSGCIPLDVFGTGVASPASVGYISGQGTPFNDFVRQTFKQEVFEASMQGTLPWELPAGKVALAFGAGYRKESAVSHAPAGAYGAGGGYAQGSQMIEFPSSSYNVLEGFAEVNAPILKNTFVNSLDVNAAGRMTSYSTSGLVETWKLGLTSQVTDDIKLRTTWSVDIRAPQLVELYSLGAKPVATVRDPKSQLTVNYIRNTAGNPNLLPEVARTISGGAVLTPTFIPGLSLSADWYAINITGLITTLAEATIENQCNPTLPSPINPGQNGNPNDPLCKLLEFNGPGGAFSQINLQVINIASESVSGLDLQANYTMDFWNGTLSFATSDTYNDENTTCNPGQGCNDAAGVNTGGNASFGPKWRGSVQATYAAGPYSVTVQSRWFGTGINGQDGNTGNKAQAATANLYDPRYFHTPFYAYLDLRANYKWNDNISFFGAIDNTLNTPPPLVPTRSTNLSPGGNIFGTNPLMFDLLGRQFRVGIRLSY